MRRALTGVVVLGLLAGACTSATDSGSVTGPTEPADPTGPTSAVADPSATAAPEPDARIPRDPRRLADDLSSTWTARRAAVEAWLASGGAAEWPPPEDLELLVLNEQRIYRELAGDPRLAGRVLERLPRGLAAEARANVRAGSALVRHFRPSKEVPDLRIRRPEPAEDLRDAFEAAQARSGVGWEILAAVMLIETRMGRVVSRSSSGARGPMQFLPSTWEAYGLGGDVRDPRDAIMGAANYLAASGSPEDDRQALFHYNPVGAYVAAVLGYAKAMARDPDAFYAYYNWQVFVRTRGGDVRLSGPGLDGGAP